MKSFAVMLALTLIGIVFLLPDMALSSDLNRLFRQVERLKLERQGYVLGKKLDKKQLQTARINAVESTTPGTIKFRDKNLFVVAHKDSSRVLVIYEQFENAGQKSVQNMVVVTSMS